jgi:HEAT repeat protein
MKQHSTCYPLSVLLSLACFNAFQAPVCSQTRLTMSEDEATESELALPQDPVVASLLEARPGSAVERVEYAEALLNFDQPEAAKKLLREVLDQQPSVSELAGIHDRLGTGALIRLQNEAAMAPEGLELASAVSQAAKQWARRPDRIEALVGQLLQGPSAAARHGALVRLRAVPDAAFGPLMAAIATSTTEPPVARAVGALIAFGRPIVGPTVAALQSDNEQVRRHAVYVLEQLDAREAVPTLMLRAYSTEEPSPAVRDAARDAVQRLTGSTPSLDQVKRYAARQVSRLVASGRTAEPLDHTGQVTRWRWQAELGSASEERMDPRTAAMRQAADYALFLFRQEPERSDYQRLYLLTNLQAAQQQAGFEKTLPDGQLRQDALRAGALPLEQVLDEALRNNQVGAAIAVAEVLADVGDESLLYFVNHERPLTRSLRHPDRRLRMAAARTVMKFDPRHAYAGAADLMHLAEYVSGTRGRRRALVLTPNLRDLQYVSGGIGSLGFDVDVASGGHEATQLILRNPDYELVFVSEAVDAPSVSEWIQHLRQHPHSAYLPICIMARGPRLAYAEAVASADPLTIAYPRPHDVDSIRDEVEQLLRLGEVYHVPAEARLRQATEALGWLTRFAGDRATYGFVELLPVTDTVREAVSVPELSGLATEFLRLVAPSNRRDSYPRK